MSLSLRSALPTLLVYGLSSPAAAPRAPIRHSLDDTTALATFEALIPSPRSALRIGERCPGLAIGAADSPFPVRGPLTRIPASHRSKAVPAG